MKNVFQSLDQNNATTTPTAGAQPRLARSAVTRAGWVTAGLGLACALVLGTFSLGTPKARASSVDAKSPSSAFRVSDLVIQFLRNSRGQIVTTDIKGQCYGKTVCQECTDACVNFKFGMEFIKVLEGVNEDGAQDETINQISDYIFGDLNTFSCTCSGL